MANAPRNHTSVYFNDYIKNHWQQLLEIQAKKGFTSFNGLTNHMYARLLDDYSLIMNQKNPDLKKRIDIYEDTNPMMREKLNIYSDGEELDLFKIMSSARKVVINDMKRRGMKI